MRYRLAERFIKFTIGIWVTLIGAALAGTIANIMTTSANNIRSIFLFRFIQWLLAFQLIQRIIVIGAAIWVLLFLIALIVKAVGDHKRGIRDTKRYLRTILSECNALEPLGSAQKGTVSVQPSLQDIFIPLQAVADRPQYDPTREQAELLEQLRRDTDLSDEEREARIQAIRVNWYSQQEQEIIEGQQPARMTLEDVLQRLTAERPVAVILGSPGSGKSTTMKWLAYHMAYIQLMNNWQRWRNSFYCLVRVLTRGRFKSKREYIPPKGLFPKQIPFILSIGDYAKKLNESRKYEIPFEGFLFKYVKEDENYVHLSRLAERLMDALQNNNCLMLLDGMDEVASDDLRRRVVDSISKFINSYISSDFSSRDFNRFILTSRITGYEAGPFNNAPHYTLQDLDDTQIKDFLERWCKTVERREAQINKVGTNRLTDEELAEADRRGQIQRADLLAALQSNPRVQQLAVNPFMLTVLARLRKNRLVFPQRRVDLYQRVTNALLEDRDRKTGREIFSPEEIPLANMILVSLAYSLHSQDIFLTEAIVKNIVKKAMADFYKREPDESGIKEIIDKLQSSGLFVERGQGFFGFMHRTIQEYYVSRYLFDLPSTELSKFIQQHWHSRIWREPILLLVAGKNGGGDERRQEASKLIQDIANMDLRWDSILHRPLLFAALCIVDCNPWTVSYDLQRLIANELFDLYGDATGRGRYTALQNDIQQVALYWLQGQSPGSSGAMPPLLQEWRTALCDASKPVRQEGAAHLLAAIATDLRSISKYTLWMLLPPLLQLADVADLLTGLPGAQTSIYPGSRYFPQQAARPSSLKVTAYAFIALRLLDAAGPAGWLHESWHYWAREQPGLLERLTAHARDLDYLLTPAAYPATSDSPNWAKRIEIERDWRTRNLTDGQELQKQLLKHSNAASFPLAYIYKRVLDDEMKNEAIRWHDSWHTFLKQEMERGNSIIYRTCLSLRLLLYRSDEVQRRGEDRCREMVKEIMEALDSAGAQRAPAINALANMFWREVRHQRYLQELQEVWILEMLDLFNIRDILTIHKLYLDYLQDLRSRRNLRYLREQQYLQTLKKILDIHQVLSFWETRNRRDFLLKFQDVSDLLDYEAIGLKLCDILKHQPGESSATILIILYSMLTKHGYQPSAKLLTAISKSTQEFEQHAKQMGYLNREHSLLLQMVRQLLSDATLLVTTSPLGQEKPDELVEVIFALEEHNHLNEQYVQKIRRACLDTRQISVEKQLELYSKTSLYLNTVQAVTWEVLKRSFILDRGAVEAISHILEGNNAVTCAAASLLAQNSQGLSADERIQIAEKIVEVLESDVSSQRSIQPSDYTKTWRPDDTLFEALKVLVSSEEKT